MKRGRKPGKTAKSAATELHILYAAADCIATHGVDGTTVRSIAQKADVSAGLVSHYFPKKAEILGQIIRQITLLAYQSIEAPKGGTSGRERILHVLDANLSFFLSHPSFYKCFILFYHYASIDRAMREMNDGFNARALERLESDLALHLGKALNSTRIKRGARIIHNLTIAAILKYFVSTPDQDQENYIKSVKSDVDHCLDSI